MLRTIGKVHWAGERAGVSEAAGGRQVLDQASKEADQFLISLDPDPFVQAVDPLQVSRS